MINKPASRTGCRVNVIQSELKAVGIQVTPDNLPVRPSTDVADGHFQLAYDWDSGGPARITSCADPVLAPTQPVGRRRRATTSAIRATSPTPCSRSTRRQRTPPSSTQVVDQLENVMLTDVPVIPVTEQVDWYQYDTQNIGGWVTQSDPYAQRASTLRQTGASSCLHLYYK